MELASKAIFGGEHGGMEIKKRYDPDMFVDPGIVKCQEYRYVYRKKADDVFLFYTALQLHYATLESIALDKPMVDHIIDTTKPNVDMIHKVSSLYLCCDVLWMELKCAYFIHA